MLAIVRKSDLAWDRFANINERGWFGITPRKLLWYPASLTLLRVYQVATVESSQETKEHMRTGCTELCHGMINFADYLASVI